MEARLGKISKVSYGFGGYDGAMFGLSVTLTMDGGSTGVCDFRGTWATRSEQAKFSEAEWLGSHTETALFVRDLLTQAKKRDVTDLVGVPVEDKLEGNALKSWRILTEVI